MITAILFITVCLIIVLGLMYFGFIWFNMPSHSEFPIRGIDVSNHQGQINWEDVQGSNFKFVFIKTTEGGDFKDKSFQVNWKQAGKIGLYRGAYHFFTFRKSGNEQANNFIESVPDEANTLPPVVDLEFTGNSRVRLSKPELLQELRIYLSILEQHYNKRPIFYVTYNFYNQYLLGELTGYKIWIRDIFKSPKIEAREWRLWQYSNRGRVRGINTYVDLNVYKGSLLEFKEEFSLE